MQYRKIFFAAFFVLFVLLWGNAAQAQITTGTAAPDITLPDQNNVNQSLSALRGNWVLVYFWVSWDGASRAGTPKLASLYGKYQNAGFASARGFRIYTVSLDSDKKEWTNAIKTDAMPGSYHVNDFYSVSAATYQIQKVPSAYLVDASGIIRAVNPSFTDVESILNADTGQGGTVAMQTFNTGASVNTAAKMESVRGGALQTATSATSYYNQTTTATTTTPAVLPEGNTYKIQIGAYKKLNLGDFYGVSHYGNVVSEPADNDIKRVMVGNFDSKQAAVDALYRIQKEGYPDAFLVEYKNAQRVRVVGKSEIQAPAAAAAPVSAVSNGNTISVPLASPPQPAADLVYRSVEPTGQPLVNSPAFNATSKGAGSSGSTVIYTAPPSYSLPSQVTVYTNTQPQNTQGTIYDQPGFMTGSDKTYVKNASVNTPSGTGTVQVYTPGDTRFSNTTATTTQPAKTTTTNRPGTTTPQPAATGNQPPVPPKQPGTTAPQPPPQPGATTQTQQPSPVVSPSPENSLDKQIDNYMVGYDYTLIENSKSKRLKNKSKREKKKDKKKK
ncbi:hypothetical protein C7N43_33430 [Sphingobacteriales bacterium UPWRP_1]|nr:hypothetical protein B6N25_01195 [Sphingobacteriales bacterium TSM_CSS]PSJ72589.1 hypothetical protein C7N43_33430 [Sphingobacteriales bacterium UPWRP_1]